MIQVEVREARRCVVAKSTAAVLEQVIRSVGRSADQPEVSDRELLRRFAEEDDQAAFATLVRRHGGMVLGVCRRALPTMQDAEDACQATFLVLLQKATSGNWRHSVANWLYTTARRVAANARRQAERRARREGRAAVPEAVDPAEQMTGRELLRALDEELDKLPPRYREPLMLCYLEGQTRDEAASRLGVAVGTVKTQLERGRKKLGDALTRRGCTLGTGLLAFAVTSPAGAFPSRLVQAILAAVSGSPPAAVAALARGVSMSVFANRLMTAVLALIGATALGIGLWLLRPALVDNRSLVEPLLVADQTHAKLLSAEESHTFSGRVLGPDGRPVSGARLWVVPGTSRKNGFDPVAVAERSGADGRFRFRVPKAKTVHREHRYQVPVMVVAAASGYFPGWAEGNENVTVRLAQGDVALKGRVTNLEGRPVAGATVRATAVHAPAAGTLDPWLAALRGRRKDSLMPREGMHFGTGVPADVLPGVTLTARTDADGRFVLAGYGKDRMMRVVVEGPGIATRWVSFVTRDVGTGVIGVSASGQPYLGAAGTLAVPPTRLITGVVRDRLTKKPLAGVTMQSYLMAGSDFINMQVKTTTDASGRFTLSGMPKGRGNVILAVPDGAQSHLGASAEVPDPAGFAAVTVDFALGRGIPIEGIIRDQAGKPVPLAWVLYCPDRSNTEAVLKGSRFPGHLAGMRSPTGPDGRFRVTGLPGKGFLVVEMEGRRYLAACDRVKEGTMAVTVLNTLPYRVRTDSCNAACAIDVPKASKVFRRDLSVETGLGVIVSVVGPDGKPVAGAESFAARARDTWKGETLPGQHRLEALNPRRLRTILFRHSASGLVGKLNLSADFTGDRCVVSLRPGVNLAGRVLDDEGKPRAGARVTLRFMSAHQDDSAESWAVLTGPKEPITTDAAGRFRIAGLPPGLAYEMTVDGRYMAQFRLDAKAAGTKELGDLKLPRREN
jgi:RNA polymerase sigma factor (sigma-70 family)